MNLINSDLIGSGTQVTAADESVNIVSEGVIVASTGSSTNAIVKDTGADSVDIVVSGAIYAGGNGIYLRQTAEEGEHSVTVTETGSIVADTFTGVSLQGDDTSVNNHGEIVAHRSTGVLLRDASFTSLVNHGSIASQGTIEYSKAVAVGGTEASEEVVDAEIINHGSLTARGPEPTVELLQTGAADLLNTGIITSAKGLAISGSDNGVDRIVNAGLIDGDVDLGSGADLFDGRGGTVSGTVFGGAGDDIYILDDATTAIEEFSGQGTDEVRTTVDFQLGAHFENLTLLGAGDIDGTGTNYQNVLIGNAGDNTLFGENSRDTIEGGAGADDIDGGVGNDVLFGGAQDDWVAGRAGNDYLDGGEADDFLFGGIGGDSMAGGEGDDTLKGGLGSDTMDGGAGADTFVFTRVADSIGGFSDVIENFEVGADVLDFTGLVSGTLDVNILGGLTGGGQASLRTFENSYGDTVVFVDADGDGSSDMRIEVNLVTGLTESDFAV